MDIHEGSRHVLMVERGVTVTPRLLTMNVTYNELRVRARPQWRFADYVRGSLSRLLSTN
jgi:hypothetical protein